MIPPERWQRIKRIFEAASQLPAAQRSSFVRAQAGADAPLAAEIEELLRQGDAMGDFLEPPEANDDLRPGDSVGDFTLISELGRGGMGVVWLAEQTHPHRTVALKLLQPSSLGGESARRFLREADLLARLSHPNIAQVFEAGTDERHGRRRPWFALELVEGSPIDEHARAAGLDVRATIGLFVKVCDAVQHAHERGIVHRDLKPANVLVTAAGEPKVLDFGIARASDLAGEAASLHTRAGLLLGTLDYMSPEQLAGDPQAIDARADVYALGVMLHELLVARRPHDVTGRPLPEAVRILSEEESAPLSKWDRRLRGDLETIVAKALEKERERRYASAAELALDLRRFLEERPIAARPASTVYQLRKFARRNRALVAGLCTTFAVLLAGATVSTFLYVRETHARREMGLAKDKAQDAEALAARRLAETTAALEAEGLARAQSEREAARAGRTKSFLLHLYDSVDPLNGNGQNVTVRAVIDAEARRLERELDDEPEVKAELLATLALVYRGLGAYERSRELFTQCIELRGAPPVADELLVADGLVLRASVTVSSLDRYEDALADIQHAIAILHQRLGEEHPRTVQARAMRAALAARRGGTGGNWDAMALAAVPMVLSLDEDSFPPDMLALVEKLRGLVDEGDMEGAKGALWRFYVESTEELRRLWSCGEHEAAFEQIRVHAAPLLVDRFWRSIAPAVVSGVATWMHAQGEDPDAVEPLLREAVSMCERTAETPPTSRARAIAQLADFLRDRGARDEARSWYGRALEIDRRVKGELHEDVARSLIELARLALAGGERALAAEHARAAAWIYRASRAEDDALVLSTDRLVEECARPGP